MPTLPKTVREGLQAAGEYRMKKKAFQSQYVTLPTNPQRDRLPCKAYKPFIWTTEMSGQAKATDAKREAKGEAATAEATGAVKGAVKGAAKRKEKGEAKGGAKHSAKGRANGQAKNEAK